MFITWAMTTLAVIAGVCQAVAHFLVHDKAERLERYAIGTFIIGLSFSIGWLIEPQQHPLTGIWLVIGASGFATWLCYYLRGRRKNPFASYVESEFNPHEK